MFNSEIDFPESIDFDGISANIKEDNKGDFIIEGNVTGVALDDNKKLPEQAQVLNRLTCLSQLKSIVIFVYKHLLP
jgi:hypothetical protein